MTTLNDYIRGKSVDLASGAIDHFAIKMEWIEREQERIADEKGRSPDINASYIRTIVSRVSEVAETRRAVKLIRNKSYETKQTLTDEGGKEYEETFFDDTYVVSLGNVSERKPRNDNATREAKAGFIEGLKVGISFVPDFVEFTPEQFEIAQGIVKQYRSHLEAVKEGLK